MKLETGKWYLDRINQKWTVDYCGCYSACGHSESGGVMTWFEDGRVNSGFDSQNDLISEWTEPKLRPWKLEEVPLGAWMREKTHGLPSLIVAIRSTSVIRGHGDTVTLDYALSHYEYSMDEGSTWKPCGVEE